MKYEIESYRDIIQIKDYYFFKDGNSVYNPLKKEYQEWQYEFISKFNRKKYILLNYDGYPLKWSWSCHLSDKISELFEIISTNYSEIKKYIIKNFGRYTISQFYKYYEEYFEELIQSIKNYLKK